MRYSLLVSFLVTITNLNISAQTTNQQKEVCNLSSVIDEVSYFWKLDSFANNGARFYSHKLIVDFKINDIEVGYLYKKLGKPDGIIETNNGITYCYNYYKRYEYAQRL